MQFVPIWTLFPIYIEVDKTKYRVWNDFSRSTRLVVISNNKCKGLFTKPLRSKLIWFHKLSRNYKQRLCNIFCVIYRNRICILLHWNVYFITSYICRIIYMSYTITLDVDLKRNPHLIFRNVRWLWDHITTKHVLSRMMALSLRYHFLL